MRACHRFRSLEKYPIYQLRAIITVKPKNSDLAPRKMTAWRVSLYAITVVTIDDVK